MLSSIWIKSIWIAGFLYLTNAIPRLESSLTISEDLQDIQAYNAVIKSMKEWQIKQDTKKTANRTKREEPSVCYEGLGCFDASGPFGYLDMLPSKPEDINTKFLLYPARNRQRRSGSAPTEVPFDKLDDAFHWAKGGFNKSLPTKVLIHGFGSDCGYIWAYEVRSALMAVEEVNTICVDWSNGAALPNYVKASANTRLVGKQLSLLLRGLVNKNGLSLMNTHLIGFSLGAHIAGFAGADLGNLSRITGLDPAGPLFESQDTRARLDETDASFVDVIHSNGENLILGGLGSSQPMGHVDFYPNGGRMQKGCSHLFVGAVSDIIWSSAVEGRSLCNHRRAYKFFIDSVSPRCHFPAFPCDSYDSFLSGKCFPCTDERKCGNMGYYADRSKGRGQLFLITREEEPFCAHQYLVKIETTPSSIPVKSYGKIQVTLIGDSFLNETFTLTRKDDEEMKPGDSISKIVVLHPILSQPTKIEILYTAYSGWLSSGLTQWRIDKVMLMDSFGGISSFCKKAQVLESGVPISLPLYPNDCSDNKYESAKTSEENKLPQSEKTYSADYIPTKDENTNSLDIEAESSRAFNSRVIKADKLNKNDVNGDGSIREVVEPILKTHSMKNGRSHSPDKELEITEPILGPTTTRTAINNSDFVPVNRNPKESKNREHINNHDDDDDDNRDEQWEEKENRDKWKRQDESKSIKNFESIVHTRSQQPPNSNPLDSIVTTVQFLPQRLARMFEQAEKYARETILPLVSTYTPRFISDFIGPREEPKYVPLHYVEEEEDEEEIQQTASSKRIGSESRGFEQEDQKDDLSVSPSQMQTFEETTTPYSHIQRITVKKKEASSTNNLASSVQKQTEHAVLKSSSISDSSNSSKLNSSVSRFDIKIDYNGENDSSKTTERRARDENDNLVYTNGFNNDNTNGNLTLMQTLAHRIQTLPDNFARILGQVQNYTRKNILPLVQTYSPRRLTDLIWIRPKPNSTMKIDRSSTNNGSMQGNNISITWSITRDTDDSENVDNRKSGRLLDFTRYITVRPEISISSTTTELITTQRITTESSTKEATTEEALKASSTENYNRLQSTTTTETSTFLDTTESTTILNNVTASILEHNTTSEMHHKLIEANSTEIWNMTQTAENENVTSNIELKILTNSSDEVSSKIITNKITASDASFRDFQDIADTQLLTNQIGSERFPFKHFNYSKSKDSNKIDRKLFSSSKKSSHIQRIPKKGEKIPYTLPQPFTIVINPDDLTTTTPKPTTTTTLPPTKKSEFVSYIQRIPKKKGYPKTLSYKLIRSHPWTKDFKVGHKVINVNNPLGADVKYRITSDGRFEIW